MQILVLARTSKGVSYGTRRGEVEQLYLRSALDMDGELVNLVKKIHMSPTKAVFYVAGGGLQV